MTADVSVIVPAHAAAETIGRALASIASQRMPPKEVIVVVDGSEDPTFEAANAWVDRLGDIALTVLKQEHAGAGAARNRAIAQATGTYLAFLDADDEWLPEKLENTLAHIVGTDKVLVSHNVRVVTNGGETVFDCARHFDPEAADQFVAMYRRGFISTSTVVARRDAVQRAGQPPSRCWRL